MYQATNDTDVNCFSGSHVIVEVQRRSGCCLDFHKIANGILCAAKGGTYNVPSYNFRAIPDDVKKSLPWTNHFAEEDTLPKCNCSFWTYHVHDLKCEHYCDNQ